MRKAFLNYWFERKIHGLPGWPDACDVTQSANRSCRAGQRISSPYFAEPDQILSSYPRQTLLAPDFVSTLHAAAPSAAILNGTTGGKPIPVVRL